MNNTTSQEDSKKRLDTFDLSKDESNNLLITPEKELLPGRN